MNVSYTADWRHTHELSELVHHDQREKRQLTRRRCQWRQDCVTDRDALMPAWHKPVVSHDAVTAGTNGSKIYATMHRFFFLDNAFKRDKTMHQTEIAVGETRLVVWQPILLCTRVSFLHFSSNNLCWSSSAVLAIRIFQRQCLCKRINARLSFRHSYRLHSSGSLWRH